MMLRDCQTIVRELVSSANPLSHRARSVLAADGESFRIMPDEDFRFRRGHLLVEYESNKRPVESVSKYWWLFQETKWPKVRRRVEVVFLLLKDHENQIRPESIVLLGRELQGRYPSLFRFSFIPPSGLKRARIREVLTAAIARLT